MNTLFFTMRTSILTTIMVLCCFGSQAQVRYTLIDAIDRGLIKLNITGNGGFTGKVATMQTENLTNQYFDIAIDCGQKIQCSDSAAQNLVITQTEFVRMTPKRIITTAVFAMCINAGKASPSNKVGFRLGQMAQGALLKLTRFIEKNKYQNTHAQNAVWSITDNKDIATIGNNFDDDYQMVNALRGFVAKEKHIVNYPKSRPKIRTLKQVEGSLDVFLTNRALVEVVLVDFENKVVKQYLRQQKEPGILRINYAVRNVDFKAGIYYVVVRASGNEVKREYVHLE